MRGMVFYVDEATATTPIDGECIVNAWWTFHPEKGLTFYAGRRRSSFLEPGDADEPSPQCNRDRHTAEHIQKRIYPDHIVKQIGTVFLRHATREMNRQRKLAREALALTKGDPQ